MQDVAAECIRKRTLTPSQAEIWELPDAERPVEGLDHNGEPDPGYAAALGLVSAPLGRRAVAALIDVGIYALLQVPYAILTVPLLWLLLRGRITWYGFVNHPDFLVAVIVAGVTAVLALAWLVGQLFMQARWGFTVGKLAAGLRVVHVAELGQAGFWRTAWRAALVWLPSFTVVGTALFLASPSWSAVHRWRGWHDRATSTWVVDVRSGLNPYDKKRMRIARKIVKTAPAPRAKQLPSLATTPAGGTRSGYRPGARTSAGVLGAARPHDPERHVVIGLTGLEPGEPAPPPDDGMSGPRLGAYVRADVEETGAAAALDTGARPGPDLLGPSTVPPAPAPAPAPQGAHRAMPVQSAIVLDDGERIVIPGPVVIGRSPRSISGALPLAISDPGFSMSKTHAVLRPVPGGLEIIDQGSTNGTVLVRQGRERTLGAGDVEVALVGDMIRVGDRTLTVHAI